jgi:hypothetical protein
MDTQKFDAITKLAANAPDRRNMLKLVGAAAVAGTAGFLARADNAEAALVTIVITDVVSGISIPIEVKNNNVAVQVCAVVDDINVGILSTIVDANGGDGIDLTCKVQQ